MLLKKSSASSILLAAQAILRGSKSENSRTYRRFFESYGLTDGVISMEIVNGEGYSASQFAHIRQFAEAKIIEFNERIDLYTVRGLGVEVDMTVKDRKIIWNLQLTPLAELNFLLQLKNAMQALCYCCEFLEPLDKDMAGHIGFADYKLRNKPCSIAEDHLLWCICGTDLRDGSSGVLEWCYDEQDALAVLASMQKFKARFPDIVAQPFKESTKAA